MNLWHGAIAFSVACIAGAINSVAGGGMLLCYPTLVWMGFPPLVANATSTASIWPGSVGGIWGYREQLRKSDPRWFLFIVPSLVGGILGAFLLRRTPPEVFAKLVPLLILFATLLFAVTEPVQRWLGHEHGKAKPLAVASVAIFQLLVATYGGYFGAGIGILMLAALGLMGFTDIHEMNGLKTLFALCINGVAGVFFMLAGMVDWPVVLVMSVGAIVGGYGGAGLARRAGPRRVRQMVILIGLGMAVSLFLKNVR